MSAHKNISQTGWYDEVVPANTYRSLLKWGAPDQFKHPNQGLVRYMKQVLAIQDVDFGRVHEMGLESVELDMPGCINDADRHFFTSLVGPENIHADVYTRIEKSYGAGMIDALRLRKKIVENIPALVISPRSKTEIGQIIVHCTQNHIPVYVFGGGSSVTRGMEAVQGGITLDMSTHLNKVVAFNEIDQTITVEAGMSGPQLESALNQAPERFQTKRRYTCGHFPQSFEYSSVGGWIVTRGAGQNSTYYGKIEDLVIAQEYITPAGLIKTSPLPRSATGPDLDQIMIGSEGTFGILTEATLKISRHLPENRRRFSYMFRDWPTALSAAREIMQSEAGFPSVFRLSDPEETEVAMNMYGLANTPADTILKRLGFKPMQKVLLLGSVDGEKGYCRNVDRQVRKISLTAGAFELSLFGVTRRWEKDRFRDPYMREDLQDFGVLIDTLECAVNWSNLEHVHQSVRSFVKNHSNTICMTHLSHAYPQGTNLYFIFIAKISSIQEYLDLQYGILEAIQKSGAGISHHHGIGKQTAPWLEENIGTPALDVIRALKQHFDPENILNPGGTLGLDLTPQQRDKNWSKDLKG